MTDQWFIRTPSGGTNLYTFPAGFNPANPDIPVPGDYFGDGITDMAVFRPSTATWYIVTPSGSLETIQFGDPTQGDVPIPGDYDGDGKTDLAVFRPGTDQWIINTSSGNVSEEFGDPTQSPPDSPVVSVNYAGTSTPVLPDFRILVMGDYDGSGKTDLTVFRPSTDQWIIQESTGQKVVQFGIPSDYDIPAPGYYGL